MNFLKKLEELAYRYAGEHFFDISDEALEEIVDFTLGNDISPNFAVDIVKTAKLMSRYAKCYRDDLQAAFYQMKSNLLKIAMEEFMATDQTVVWYWDELNREVIRFTLPDGSELAAHFVDIDRDFDLTDIPQINRM